MGGGDGAMCHVYPHYPRQCNNAVIGYMTSMPFRVLIVKIQYMYECVRVLVCICVTMIVFCRSVCVNHVYTLTNNNIFHTYM